MGLSTEQKEILKLLRKLWQRYPDQRLGQLLENYVFFEGKRGDLTSVKLFFQEDWKTQALLECLLKRVT
jgi:uncharacterized protein YihD (DUF1040 family)